MLLTIYFIGFVAMIAMFLFVWLFFRDDEDDINVVVYFTICFILSLAWPVIALCALLATVSEMIYKDV